MTASPVDELSLWLRELVTSLDAAFGLVLRLDAEQGVLRPAAQARWPAQHQGWLASLRIAPGDGPSGRALVEQQLVDVVDVEADPLLVNWVPVARELGYRGTVSIPLPGPESPVGVLTLYFQTPRVLSAADHRVLHAGAARLGARLDARGH